MAATATVEELNGAPTGDPNTVTNVRFCTTDAYNPVATYPIPIPDSGTNYSYWKTLRLKFTGSYTQVTNVLIYSDGTGFGTGITTNIGDEVGQTYEQATGTPGATGDIMTDHTSITGVTDLMTYVSTAAKTVDDTTLSGDPDYAKEIVLQMVVIDTATAGTLAAETITWQYDEI